MTKVKKKSPAEREYDKQVKRIKQFVRRAEKRGFIFPDNVIPDKPKRITKASVRKLSKITPKELYKKAEYGGEASEGEIVSAKEGLELERKVRAKKASQTRKRKKEQKSQQSTNEQGFKVPYNPTYEDSFYTRIVISKWYATLDTFRNGEAYNLLRVWLGNIIRFNGIENTAEMLTRGAEAGHLLTWEVVYKMNKATLYIGYMVDYLPDQDIHYKDEVMDLVEYWKRLGDALEQEEDWEFPL